MQTIIQKLDNEERLNENEANKLWDFDLFTLGKYAQKIRTKLHGKKVYFNINRHINPTNICADTCKFCAFSAHRKNPNPYTMTHEQIMNIIDETVQRDTKEIHIVSAHNKNTSWEWYLEIFRMIKQKYPFLHIKALTAAEVDFLSRAFNMSYEQIIEKMLEYGVDSMPGGGAEIFDEEIRKKICHGKVSSQNWLKIHKLWHEKGRQSNATMLFGHIEDRKHRTNHMIRLRELQDQTGGFNAFIPLVWQQDNSFITNKKPLGSVEILKTLSIARIVLDNIKNIKAYWATMGINLAMVAQDFGANDLDGTIEKESIQSAGGAKSANGLNLKTFIELIQSSGYVAIERDSLYNELKTY
ncbi:aminofutalosine synthase MqnE [Campylobacter insulaenigrae]|uniref:Aminodeoxyfutalosine synthase n=1 Tax=Campylobacter insulaenigrae NCTC 12927 TaxID=1031564 RepID=A0A0A8H0V6_9BACT|nr:aminofutalosine synthase MqnE [Campylobacter insulaenigrae]AJC87405.1 menaquinone biosynthesis protein, SCO4494 family [Campylobacter insulaenigrae NCTC 12927]MCR6570516.1 aminofutalosine synthase MqnE [Campylobacter insulaenigrae]MCR6572067.1 aminofutalosine synthase MqnE [Campylobacter insulaenigrae]MCR6576731.1 aminofutalosine synthase MqnE [Campylobacter insulaenigrae]MCR6581057.1 aminofutalosine synthase MqnE [Campylobacter insulaenigrae]